MNMTADVFISYSRKNKRFADILAADLRDHQVTVWLDTLEIEPGDRPRQRIEDAIEQCTFFCLIISEASMSSFYVRKLELEAAFAKMISSRRDTFILPLLRQKPKSNLPLMLRSFHYLDCSNIKKVKLSDENFTGPRLYKNLDTSFTGHMVGVGPIHQIPHHGAAVCLYFHDGRVRTMETYLDGKPDATKSVIYDEKMRVFEIVLFRDNKVVDTWQYIYDLHTGLRSQKIVYKPGQKPHLVMEYDQHGRRISESYYLQDGQADDSKGYAQIRWTFDADGKEVTETRLDAGQNVIWARDNGTL